MVDVKLVCSIGLVVICLCECMGDDGVFDVFNGFGEWEFDKFGWYCLFLCCSGFV